MDMSVGDLLALFEATEERLGVGLMSIKLYTDESGGITFYYDGVEYCFSFGAIKMMVLVLTHAENAAALIECSEAASE